MQRVILCYGDSNTWGYIPVSVHDLFSNIKRYPFDLRWVNVLQNLLGENYHVIEEGLNSRTTNLDYAIPPNRNGKTYLLPCLYSHAPIDLVVLALGGNDLKNSFNRQPRDISDGLGELVDLIQASHYGSDLKQSPAVLIIPPPIPLPISEKLQDENGIAIFEGASQKAKILIACYADLAKQKECYFLDTSNAVYPSQVDGLHFDIDAHKKLATMVHEKVKEIFL